MRWIALLCCAAACGPPPAGPDEPAVEEVREVEEVSESCDSTSSQDVELSSGDPCIGDQDYELPLSCARECSGCDDEQDCEAWCTGAGSDRRLDLSGCDLDRLFGG